MEATQRSRSRASIEPYHHYKDGHIVTPRLTMRMRQELAETYSRVRYSTPEYFGMLHGRSCYTATCEFFKSMRVLRILKLCDHQENNPGERLVGRLYCELDTEGYDMLDEIGVKIARHAEDGQFAHTLAGDLWLQSLWIGVKQDPDISLTFRDDLPPYLELQAVQGKKRFYRADQIPLTLTKKGKKRHIAGVEVETGSNAKTRNDIDRSAVAKKLSNIKWLIESGEIERVYGFGNNFVYIFLFRTTARMNAIIEYWKQMTKDNHSLRAHVAFSTHPIFGKSAEKPRATGHALTEPYKRADYPDLYLNGGPTSARQ